jgi:hypothetical protein
MFSRLWRVSCGRGFLNARSRLRGTGPPRLAVTNLRDRNPCLVTVAFSPSSSARWRAPALQEHDTTKTRSAKFTFWMSHRIPQWVGVGGLLIRHGLPSAAGAGMMRRSKGLSSRRSRSPTVSFLSGSTLDDYGVIERFMRTLKEQCLYLHRFQNLAEARRLIGEFIARYNTEWLIERLGHQTPVAGRIAAMAA